MWLFPSCCFSPVVTPHLLFLAPIYSLLAIPHLLLLLICCFSFVVAPCLSFLPTCCSPSVVFPCLLLHTHHSSPLVAPHSSLLICYSPPITPPCLLLFPCVSLDGVPSPLFVLTNSLWSYKQQVKTNKQGEFFFLVAFLHFLFDHS